MRFVVIELDDFVANSNVKPFKNILKEPAARSNSHGRKKTLFGTWFYLFRADVGANHYYKIGETADPATYHSKNRYCPWQDYQGLIQVQHYGRVLETLMKAYLRRNYKDSEWYIDCADKLDAFERALMLNEAYQPETPVAMAYVASFERSFTGKHKTTLDDYLSLFRVRYKGKVYVLTERNIELPLRQLAVDAHLDLDLADGAPAAPAVAPAKTAPALPAKARSASSSLSASAVLSNGDDDDDDEDESEEEESSESSSKD